jgi:ribosomal protein S18 acetylase RimI-like enzyme
MVVLTSAKGSFEMVTITKLDRASAQPALPQLIEILVNSVESGASVGFLLPISDDEAAQYWNGRIQSIAEGTTVLLAAQTDERIVGVVLLALEPRANGSHRAEVQKLMVHTDFRRQGIGRKLMEALESAAKEHQRTLLFLDTREGDPSNALYEFMGYIYAGTIPQYARSTNGDLHDTCYYYKLLE